MKYIVMECHTSYAVVLSEDGRFLKAANLRYEVGQTVTKIVEMIEPESEILEIVPWEPECSKKEESKIIVFAGRRAKQIMAGLAAAAACLVVAVTSVFHLNQQTFGSVYMTINPEVRIDVNRKNVVVDIDGLNDDGEQLVEGYSYKKKQLDPVMDELVDRAIEQGFLHEGGQILLDLEAEDEQWITDKGNELKIHLDEYLTEKISVTIEVGMREEPVDEQVEISLPGESEVHETAVYHESDYGETVEAIVIPLDDFEDSPYNESYSDYEEESASDYEEELASDYEESDSDYEEADSWYEEESASDYGEEPASDYGEESASDYEEESVSDYEEELASDYEEEFDRDYEDIDDSDFDD